MRTRAGKFSHESGFFGRGNGIVALRTASVRVADPSSVVLYFVGFVRGLRGHLFEANRGARRLAPNAARYPGRGMITRVSPSRRHERRCVNTDRLVAVSLRPQRLRRSDTRAAARRNE